MKAEVELKYAVTDLTSFVNKLEALGALLIQSSAAEENTVYDTVKRTLKESGRLLRLRSYAGRVILTVKEPCIKSTMKHRTEHETDLSTDLPGADALLKAVGYIPVYTYSKIREEWVLGECHICLDSLYFGSFVEVEGESPEAVLKVSELLELDPRSGLKESYRDLERLHTANGNLPIS